MPNQFGFDFSGGLGSCEPILIQFWSVGVGGYAFVDGGIFFRRRADVGRLKPESTEGRPWGQPLKKPEGAPLNLG